MANQAFAMSDRSDDSRVCATMLRPCPRREPSKTAKGHLPDMTSPLPTAPAYPRSVALPDAATLAQARDAVRTRLTPTPVIESTAAGHRCLLKLETLQPSGSFKVRGAIAAASRLIPGSRIVTASAGNHALGIAWAAERLGIPAISLATSNAPRLTSPSSASWFGKPTPRAAPSLA